MILFFYYGLLFLGTLSISDGVATFLVLCLVDFLILKTIWQDYEPFVSWRKKQYKPLIKLKKQATKELLKRWKKASLLKRAYIIVAGLVGFTLLILFAHLYLEVFLFNWNTTETTAKEDSSIRNLAIAFLGTTSGIGALFGVYLAILRSEENTRQNKIANDQNEITEQGLITDRINKATEGLGKSDTDGDPVIEVRIGALYALERIAQDSFRDHIQIMEIFCTYIRYNSPRTKTMKKLRDDIQTALEIIGRRDEWPEGKKRLKQEATKGYSLNLGNCNLNYSKIRKANFGNAKLHFTNLNHAWFNDTNLNNVWFNGAELKGARLNGATTVETYAQIGDFSNCLTFTQEQINTMFLGVDVKLGKDAKLQKDLIHPQKDTKYYKTYDTFEDFMEAYEEWKEAKK